MCEKVDGFNYSFDPKKCEICGGKCCIGESGYIWVNQDEIKKISEKLKLDLEVFKQEFLIKIKGRYSIKEIPYNDGFACVFFNTDTKKCKIYDCRPNQCKSFPFWNYFKKNFDELEKECIGVKHF